MIYKFFERDLLQLNAEIKSGFHKYKDSPDTNKSHYFENRFENIFIKQKLIPALDTVFENVLRHAVEISGEAKELLRLGFWFNYMGPGDQTLAHSHDEDNEVLSCVYYVDVPDLSGDLYLGEGCSQQILTPNNSLLVFFPPNLVHSVSTNNSELYRLSIGMNICKQE